MIKKIIERYSLIVSRPFLENYFFPNIFDGNFISIQYFLLITSVSIKYVLMGHVLFILIFNSKSKLDFIISVLDLKQ